VSSPAVPRSLPRFVSIGRKAEELSQSETAISRLDDETLMTHVQAGDREALGALFDRYSRLMFGVAARILRDVSEAQELVQDIFVNLFVRKENGFNSAKTSFRSWLIQVVYYRAFDRRDYLNARRFYDSCEIGEVVDSVPAKYCLESQAQATELRQLLEQALSELNERQKRTLQLFFFEGHSLAEISAQLDEPLGNVRHHYYRGLDKLRQVFKLTRSALPDRWSE
jgi:RNA polymerase sigma-70 factor (ECF subfamily)